MEWCLCLGLGLFFAVWIPAIPHAGGAARRAQCMNNLKQIGLALHNYQEACGCFPPAYTTDQQGRRLHSWRVLLLPYLEYQGLYDDLLLDEPWNSEHNQAVVAKSGTDWMLQVYQCPSDDGQAATDTSYVMLVGPGTISDGRTCTSLDDVLDGAENTIAVTEMSNSGIHWMEPRDLSTSQMSWKLNDPDAPSVRSGHTGLACAVFLDGHVDVLHDDTSPEDLKALSTIAGGEHPSDAVAGDHP